MYTSFLLVSRPKRATRFARPARECVVVNRAEHTPRQVPLVARVARLPAGQIQPIAQPIADVLGKVACEPIAPACNEMRGVVQCTQA
jgi:hypothetical protein